MQVHKGKRRQPPKIIIYGTEGIGKSSLAATAPAPIFLPTEDGLAQIDCESLPVSNSYDEFLSRLGEVCQEDHEYQTVIIDTVDWLERHIWAATAKKQGKKNIEDIGYGKGFEFAMDLWKEVVEGLTYLHAEKKMAIILLAHAKIEKFNDPDSVSYDRYTLRLNVKANDYLREWSDAVLFATQKKRIETQDAGFNRERSIAKPVGSDGGERVLRTVYSPSCVAKNRYGMPGEIPMTWAAIAEYLN